MLIPSIAYGLVYMVYMSLGWSHPQNKKPFRKLFDNKIYFIHLLIQMAVSTMALLGCQAGFYECVFLYIPLAYLLLLRALDPIVVKIAGRHIYFVGKGDVRPRDYKWQLDAPVALLIIALPLINSLLLINYFKFGVYGLVH